MSLSERQAELEQRVDDELLVMVTREKLDELYAQCSVLGRWRGWIRAAIASGDELKRGPPDRAALIGRLPPGAEPEQLRLASQSVVADSWPLAAADGGKPADTSGVGMSKIASKNATAFYTGAPIVFH